MGESFLDEARREPARSNPECESDSVERAPEPTLRVPETPPPATSDDALRLAIKLAVDEGDLDRAVKLIDVLKATAGAGSGKRGVAEG